MGTYPEWIETTMHKILVGHNGKRRKKFNVLQSETIRR